MNYAVAFGVAVGAVALSQLTVQPFGGAYFYLPLVAVFYAALHGGVGPGLLSAFLCAAGFDFLFLGEPFRFGVATREEAHRVAGFVLFGVAASLLAGRFRAARDRAERAREEAEAAGAEARRIGELQERLVAVVSHDLRNPLGALRAGLELLPRLGPLADRQRVAVTRMRGTVDRMDGLIRDILDLARTRNGAVLAVQLAPARLGAICARVVGELEAAYPDVPITVAVDGDDHAELDEERLAQLVSNLVGNAIVHGDRAAGVAVRVRGGGPALRLEVENRGPPIAPELAPHLFEPFRRAGHDTRGLGLGLYIVKEIARAHGGEVAARSADGSTVFEVVLPREARAAPPAA
ncbi:hypothetical protein AMOR_07810 [Anaeromyxobacter oryzae]|uniref:histidine kinase n=2 Tax=Anaeromyxobacter oryzae TaxID=2918170 RepID=A0ABM7WQP5_9BACT|nr:hypothetical protein AMOR_07810 [Anaeromyxobacter oryzae]